MDIEIDVDGIAEEIERQMSEPESNVRPLGETRKPDKELAAEYRAELTALLGPVCELLDRAKRDGFVLGYNTSPDQYGRTIISQLTVVKPL